MKPTLFAALTAIASCGHLEFTQLDTFEGLAADNGYSESCHYDATDMVWRFTDISMEGEMDTLSGDYPTSSEFTHGFDTNNGTGGFPLGMQYVAGTATVDPRLYIADGATGSILVYDIITESFLNDATIALNSANVNGLCYDSDNDVLYAGNIGADFANNYVPVNGLAAIWKISDVSTDTPTKDRINVTNVVDQNGDALTETNAVYIAETGPNRVFMPNGCAVLNGMVYFVETRPMDMTGSLGVYNPSTDEFYVNTEVLQVSGDGLVAYGDYLIASSWGSFDPADEAGILLSYDTTDDSAEFEIALEGLVNPADIGVNDEGLLCVPSLNQANGVFFFVQLDEHLDMTTTMLAEETTEDAATTAETTEDDDEESGAFALGSMMALIAACIAVLF